MPKSQRSRAITVQWAIVWLGFAAFVVTARLFGGSLYWPMVGSAVILWGTMAAVARRLGSARPAGYYEPLVVMFVSIIPVVVAVVVSGAREYAVIAAGLFGLGSLSGQSPPADYPSLPAIVVSYFAGFLATGLLVGLLRPLARFSLGTMLLGMLGAFCVYGAVGVPMLGFPLRWEHFFLGLGMALLVGPAFGLGIRTRVQ